MTAVGPTAGPELELEFPAKPEYLRMVRHAVGALGHLHDGADEVVEDIKLAVSEACTGAVPPAGDAAAPSDPLRLSASVEGDRLTVELTDPGRELQRAVAGPLEEIDTGDLPFERTLSLSIIRGLVDEVALSPLPGGGASIRMTMTLEGPAGE